MAKSKPEHQKPNRHLPSAQKYLDIAEIKEDVVLMRDGTIRSVLIVSSINFDLKSEDEQASMVGAYVTFLNSLTFPLQIVIQSRPLNIDDYLERLKKTEREHTNELLRMQTADYRNFVSELLELESIMSKRFFVIVNYNPINDQRRKYSERLLDVFTAARKVVIGKEKFEKYSRELTKRSIYISSGLSSMGLQVERLNTQALIELYYNSYNPTMYQSQPLEDVNNLAID